MPRGLFITLEGLDGSGKTTQIKRLAGWLQRRGLDPVVTRQPGGTATGDRIRALLLDSGSSPVAPTTEMALMFADRAQAIAEVIEPALAAGRVVLCDRFTDSTEAYQGGGRQLGSAECSRTPSPHLRRPPARPHPASSAFARIQPRPRPQSQRTHRRANRQRRGPLRTGARRPSIAASGKSTARSQHASPTASSSSKATSPSTKSTSKSSKPSPNASSPSPTLRVRSLGSISPRPQHPPY